MITRLFLAAVAALPAGAITLDRLDVKPTFECVGIRIAYSGGEAPVGKVAVRYREKGAAAWRQAHAPIPIKGNRLVTSLFWLGEGVTYEIDVQPSDPGVTVAFRHPVEATTRSARSAPATQHLYVDAAGRDPRAAFRTIQEAADAAQPGSTIHVFPGVYREEVRPPRSGVRFVGEGDGVLLDGGETIPTAAGWTDAGDGVWSRPYARTPRYASLDGQRLYRHSSLENLKTAGDGITGGFFTAGGTLYVNPPDRKPIAGRTLRAGVLGNGFYVERRAEIEIRNFEIGWYENAGIHLRDTRHSMVRDCRVHDSRDMIVVRGEQSTDNLIEGNRATGTGVPDWPWEICHHGHDCSSNGISVSGAGEGNVVRRNHVSGVYNGIYVGGWVKDYPETWALENDVYENTLELIKDDGVEPECQAINLRIFRNTFRNLFVAISLAPIETGPTWVMYNLIHHTRGHDKGKGTWMKISTTPKAEIAMGAIRIYHNTAYYDDPEHSGWGSVGSGNTWFVNNVVHCTRSVFEHRATDPYPAGNWWDYNNFYTTDPARYVSWQRKPLTLEQFRETTGFQRHGIQAPPRFRNPAAGDFHLLAGDPGIDKAQRLPGINDGYAGAGPDMGAFEFRP